MRKQAKGIYTTPERYLADCDEKPMSDEATRQKDAEQAFYDLNEVVMDEEDAARRDLRRFAIDRIDRFFSRGLRMLVRYKGNLAMALDCFCLALGQGEMVDAKTAVDISVKHFGDETHKATVTECIKTFQDCLGIPPMPGQRDEKGQQNMAAAQTKQLASPAKTKKRR